MRFVRKTLSILLALVLAFSAFALVPFTAQADASFFVKNAGNTQFGTGGIGYPRSSTEWNSARDYGGKWSYVWYGKYRGQPVRYRVLNKASNAYGVDGGSMLMDCDVVFGRTPFTDGGNNTVVYTYDSVLWENSTIRSWLNGSEFLNNTACFTPIENAAIAPSYITDGYSSTEYNVQAQPVNGDKLFILDEKDVGTPAYGYICDNSSLGGYHAKSRQKTDPDGNPMGWWLRTYAVAGSYQGSTVYMVMLVGGDIESEDQYWYGGFLGTYSNHSWYMGPIGVSPAMNLRLSDIMFSSCVDGGAKEFKLTLKDPSLSASVQAGQTLTRVGSEVTVPYTASGDVNTLSVMITDKPYGENGASIRYYAPIKTENIGSSGTATFTLPNNCGLTDHVYLIAEHTGDIHETDSAGTPCEVTIPSCTVTFNANGGTVSPQTMTTGTNGKIANLPKPVNAPLTFLGWFTAPEGGEQIRDGVVFSSDITLYAQWTDVYYVDVDGEIKSPENCMRIQKEAGVTRKKLDPGWYAVVEDVTLDPNTGFDTNGDVNLILCDGVTLTVPDKFFIKNRSTLTIYGQIEGTGKLAVTGRGGLPSLGDNKDGFLIINGGVIEASCSSGPAIGGNGTNVIINGGVITATGGTSGAGIGTERKGNPACNVTINGGVVTAVGGENAAAIGGGEASSAGNITINGGVVTATTAGFGAAIGGGGTDDYRNKPGNGGTITINGGQITARNNIDSHRYSNCAIGPGNSKRDGYGTPSTLIVNLTNEEDFLVADSILANNVTVQSPMRYTVGDEDLGAVTPENLKNKNDESILRPGKSGVGIAIEQDDMTVPFGTEPFALTASVETPGTNGVWTWTSSDPDIAQVNGYGEESIVTPKKTGTVTIAAAYTSDIMDGADSIELTVEKADEKELPAIVRCVEMDEPGISIDIKDVIPYDVGQISAYIIDGQAVTTGSVTLSDVAIGDVADENPGVITATMSGGAANDTITIPVRITGSNYDCTLTVTVNLVYTGPVSHEISVTHNAGGTVEVDRFTAFADESVLVTVEPDYGSIITSITVTDADNNELTLTDGQFIMPDADVTVTVDFTQRYSYDWATHELRLISGDFSTTDKWDSLIYPGDVESVTAEGDVRFVGDCSGMFRFFTNCTSMDLSAVDTTEVTDMSNMFYSCYALESLDLSGWSTDSCESMNGMFSYCGSLQSLDLSGLVSSTVKDLNNLFFICSALENVNLSGWDTSGVEHLSYTFAYCKRLSELDLTGWDTSAVTEMSETFAGCSGLSDLTAPAFDLRGVEDLYHTFEGCSFLTYLDLSGWDVSETEFFNGMFLGCECLTGINLSGWNTSSALDFSDMFMNCSCLWTLELNGFDVTRVYSMSRMFAGCTELYSVRMNNWQPENVCDLSEMFRDCRNLIGFDLDWLNLNSVENVNGMFSGCTNLVSVALPKFTNVWDAGDMFKDCASLTALDLTNLPITTDGEEAVNAYGMFLNCGLLQTITLAPNTAVTEEMFLKNGNPFAPGWIVEGDDTQTVISGSGDFAQIAAPGEPTVFVWKNTETPMCQLAHSLTLNGSIGVNFYVDVPNAAADTYAEFTVDGQTVNVPIDPDNYILSGSAKLYKFTCCVAAAQIDSMIEGRIVCGNEESGSFTYSVQTYLTEAMQTLADDPPLIALCSSLATYGYYANELFGYNSDFKQHILFDDSAFDLVSASDFENFDAEITNEATGVTYIGSSLVLRTATAIRHYFTLPKGATLDDFTFLLGEGEAAVELTPQANGTSYYVEIPDIPSAELANAQIVIVTDGEGNEVNVWCYSALSYVYKALTQYENGNAAISEGLAAVVKALTLYNQAAKTYFTLLNAENTI